MIQIFFTLLIAYNPSNWYAPCKSLSDIPAHLSFAGIIIDDVNAGCQVKISTQPANS